MSESESKLNIWPSVLIAAAASSFALVVGYELGWASPVQKKLEEGEQGYKVSEKEFSLVGSIFPLGAAIACIPTGILLDVIGRKIIIIAMGVLGTVGWILMAFIKKYIVLCIARVIHGVAAGAFCSSVPLYISEISHKSIRGALASTFQLQITLGILLAFTLGYFVSANILAIIGLIISIVATIIFIFVPESPTFLTKKEEVVKTEKALKLLRGRFFDVAPEQNELKVEEAESKKNPVSLKEAFSRRATLKGILYAGGLMFFQQLCGINAVIFYTVSIFDAAKSGLDPGLCTIIVGVIQVIATIIATLLVDKIGRRFLLIPSALLMAVSTFCLGIYFFMLDRNKSSVSSVGWLPLVSVCLFIVMFSFGFGPVPWCVMGEIFPSDIRGKCASLAATVNWLLAFVVTMTFPLIKNFIGAGPTFWIFCAITILGLLFVWFILPETKGKSLQEIQKELE